MTSDQEMRGVVKRATGGPWTAKTSEASMNGVNEYYFRPSPNAPQVFSAVMKLEDAELIEHSREWVPETLDRLDAVRELHAPLVYADAPGIYFCKECQYTASGGTYPCRTRRILDAVRELHEPDWSDWDIDHPEEEASCTCGYNGTFSECSAVRNLDDGDVLIEPAKVNRS